MCGDLTRTLYLGPFRNAINIGSNENYFDMRVGASFIDTWRNYKTGSLKEANEAAYRVTEEIKHIFGFRDLQIDSSFDGRTLQLLINGRSFKLPEVGSGLTEFILVLINATIQNPSFIFIDEPESHLHPSLQLDFLSTLAAHAAYGVVFATHSIGLARASSDTVYTVRRNETLSEVRPLESTPRLAEFSGELGFFSYKQLGFDQLLLVEGPTEVRTFHQFLRMVKKDHEIVVLPLGGSSLINAERELELSEIKRITDRVYAVIDSEKPGPDEAVPDDRQQFKSLCEKLRITCRILDRRAIENYLSDQAIKTIKGDKYSALTSYERLKDCAMPWAKSENWRIAREMVFDEIKNTDLGEFLRSL
jgi:energy-coupling factor transporter ATP-binding protein EcfA2